jgi:hypothetical protein
VAARAGGGAIPRAGVGRGRPAGPDHCRRRDLDMRELVITNGDSAAGCLKAARLAEKIIPWSDILYEGPVPMREDLASLSRMRGQYIVMNQWAGLGIDASEVFAERDTVLAAHTGFDRVTLWFEHDLCDQLQLIQILDWFATSPRTPGTLHLIQTDDYIGAQEPSTVGRFLPRAVPITDDHLSLARGAWHAFRQPTPMNWANLLDDDLHALPFLRAAVIRMLEELPATGTGLTRTERQVLTLARGGCRNTRALLKKTWAAEDARFMGDWSVFSIIDRLAYADAPLLRNLEGGPYSYTVDFWGRPRRSRVRRSRHRRYIRSIPKLTDLGREILAGREDYARHTKIDRWWGGTHLTHDNLWRWDAENCRLIAP